nr:MAG TPA: hypothetical protein [Caudoviricetes sp.]
MACYFSDFAVPSSAPPEVHAVALGFSAGAHPPKSTNSVHRIDYEYRRPFMEPCRQALGTPSSS